MLTPTRREKLVFSTRWFDEEETIEPAEKAVIEIVRTQRAHEERLEALSQRVSLTSFLKHEARFRPASV